MVKERDQGVVWLRALACIMIVTFHVVQIGTVSQDPSLRMLVSIIQRFTRLGPPLFAMISGHLFFSRSKEPSLMLAGKRAWSIFKLIIYFGTIYYLWDVFHDNNYYPYHEVFFRIKYAGHLWYLYTILIPYVVATYITLPKGKPNGFYYGMVGVLALAMFIKSPVLPETSYIDIGDLFSYMIMGFALGQLTKKEGAFEPVALIILYLLFAALTALGIRFYRGEFQQYSNPIIVGKAICLFILFTKSMDLPKILSTNAGRILDKILSIISVYSLGIYGWHILVINLAQPFWASDSGIVIFMILVWTFTSSLLVAIFDTWFWEKVRKLFRPLGERFLGLVKSIKMGYNTSK